MFGKKIYLPYLLILLGVLVFVYFSLGSKQKNSEGFVSNKWSPETIQNFLEFENTRNPILIFDVSMIQEQATEDEVKILLSTGKWPWNEETKKMYMNALKSNTMLKTSPGESMNQAMEIYNQKVIREMLSWNAPEGQFLLRGAYSSDTKPDKNQELGSGTYGTRSGLIAQKKNLIKCGVGQNNNVSLQEVLSEGDDGITGVHKKKTILLDYNKLPSLLKGFRFIKEPCNPCVALDDPPNYSCAFSLTDKAPSPIWSSLWGF